MSDEEEPIVGTLLLKIPFLLLGILIGMGVVWVALLWVPGAMMDAASDAGFIFSSGS